jgi:hypothetical protein
MTDAFPVTSLQADDVVVIRFPERITATQAAEIRARLQTSLGAQPILVIDSSAELSIIRRDGLKTVDLARITEDEARAIREDLRDAAAVTCERCKRVGPLHLCVSHDGPRYCVDCEAYLHQDSRDRVEGAPI